MCQAILCLRLWDKLDNFHRIDRFFQSAPGPEKEFPQSVFLEPSYGGDDENDQHPPTDMRKGEYLIAQVYNALRSNAVSGIRPSLCFYMTSTEDFTITSFLRAAPTGCQRGRLLVDQ